MLRQERLGAGMADQKDLDAQYARAVMGDGKFQVNAFHCWLLRKMLNNLIIRMILTTLMTMLRNWAVKRCVLMP